MTGIYHDTITQDIQFFLLDIQKDHCYGQGHLGVSNLINSSGCEHTFL